MSPRSRLAMRFLLKGFFALCRQHKQNLPAKEEALKKADEAGLMEKSEKRGPYWKTICRSSLAT
jgi:hypothetical protein